MARKPSRRMQAWKPISQNELWKFLGMKLMMGLNRKPDQSNYWSKDLLFHQSIFADIMSSDRYFEIMRYLHFANNDDMIPGDRLFKIRSVVNILNSTWKSLLKPSLRLSIDESLIGFKGRLLFRQYNPLQRDQIGIKTFSVVDALTGFVLNTIVYSGKGHQLKYSSKDFGYGGAIILELIEPYLGKGHHLYADNWFTSPNLVNELKLRDTLMCGTVKRTLQNMPKSDTKKMKKGQIRPFCSNNVLVEYWQDRKSASIISTIHSHEMVPIKPRHGAIVMKPKSVADYNLYARGVDQADMMISYYSPQRKSMKWTKKVFFHLFMRAIKNSFDIRKSLYGKIPFLPFVLDLIREMIMLDPKQAKNSQNSQQHLRLQPGKHFPALNLVTSSKATGYRRCVVCSSSKKRKMTKYHCSLCKQALCVTPCFEAYHTKQNF